MRKKKGIFGIITAFVAAFVATALAACSEKAPTLPPIVFTLDKTHIELTVDGNLEVLTLTSNVDEAIEWKSSDTSIATVSVMSDNKASVRPVGKGQTVISVVAGEYIAVCTVKVNPAVNLELLTPNLELLSGTTAMIDVETDAESLTYSSNNTSVATVNSSGLVTGISGGTARITVSGGGKSVICYVTVTDPYVNLDKNELFLTLEETYRLTAESNGEVEWRTENRNIAIVEDGLITAVSIGDTKIVASYASAEAECAVIVVSEKLTLTLSEEAHTLKNGETFKLTATIIPEQTGDDAKVTWSVLSGGDLVSVDDEGNVTANNENKFGEAVIVATSVKDSHFTKKCTVTVPDPRADWIMISDKASFEAVLKSGNENKTMYLTKDIDLGGATINSTLGAYNGTFYGNGFEISNFTCGSLFGSIGNDGVVERLAITCNATNVGSNMGLFGEEIRGTIENCRFDITFGNSMHQASFGRNGTSTAKFTNIILLLRNPSATQYTYAGCSQGGGTWQNVYYAVYDEGSVNAGGPTKKTDEEIRDASLYAEYDEEIWLIEDGEIPVLANDNNMGIKVSLNAANAELYVGESDELVATVKPVGLSAADKAVVWDSSDEKILTVVGGVIRGVKAGTAIVTVRSAVDPERTATCTVTVKAIEISIDTTVTELKTNGSKQLSATVNHGGYKWESSDSAVATVNADGLVTAIGEGIVTITVRSLLDPTAIDTVTIEVKDNIVISVVLSNTTLTLDRDDSTTLIATVINSDGGVQWSSSDDTIASVDENGKVTTYGVDGTAVITATANEADGDGNYAQASCTVTVELVPVTVTPSGDTEFEIALGSKLTVSELATASKGELTASIINGDDFVSLTDGVITAVADGTATVRIASSISYDDYAAAYIDISITVFTPAVEMKMNAARYSTGLTSTTLSVTLDPMPESAAAGDIIWTSSDETVISSISGGVASGAYTAMFTPKKYGFATITASYTYGGRTYTASCEVEVFDPKGAIAVSTVDGLKSALSTVNGNFYLACDIDFGDTVYTTSFAGTVVSVTLDGRGYALKNIKTNFSANEIGFINLLDGLTVLKNIAFIGFDIDGTESFMYGGLIGSITANASLSNCYFEGVISARRANEHYVGTIGTIHTPTSKIENCVFNVGFGDGALDGSNANANPKVIAGRWFNGTITAFVNATAIGGDKILVAPLNGQEKLAGALKTEDALKSPSTYDSSWSAWVIVDGELPRLRTGWDD